MSERARSVLRWIHYGEYVNAWYSVGPLERPTMRVVREDGEWRLVAAVMPYLTTPPSIIVTLDLRPTDGPRELVAAVRRYIGMPS